MSCEFTYTPPALKKHVPGHAAFKCMGESGIAGRREAGAAGAAYRQKQRGRQV